jgi:hypothetical protein
MEWGSDANLDRYVYAEHSHIPYRYHCESKSDREKGYRTNCTYGGVYIRLSRSGKSRSSNSKTNSSDLVSRETSCPLWDTWFGCHLDHNEPSRKGYGLVEACERLVVVDMVSSIRMFCMVDTDFEYLVD